VGVPRPVRRRQDLHREVGRAREELALRPLRVVPLPPHKGDVGTAYGVRVPGEQEPAIGEDDAEIVPSHELRERPRDTHLDLTVTGKGPRFAEEPASLQLVSQAVLLEGRVLDRGHGAKARARLHVASLRLTRTRGKESGERHCSRATPS
jgi:hypothetical protein